MAGTSFASHKLSQVLNSGAAAMSSRKTEAIRKARMYSSEGRFAEALLESKKAHTLASRQANGFCPRG